METPNCLEILPFLKKALVLIFKKFKKILQVKLSRTTWKLRIHRYEFSRTTGKFAKSKLSTFLPFLPHIFYPKSLKFRVLVSGRIKRSAVEGQNGEMFQKFDLPLSIPLNTRTLVYNKPCSPQACTINNKRTNYATNYFAWVLLHKPRQDIWFQWPEHGEPYQRYERLLIGVSVLSTFKQYRTPALYYFTLKVLSFAGRNFRGYKFLRTPIFKIKFHGD